MDFIFIKIYIYNFSINICNRKEKSKLCFANCIAIINDFFYQTGGSKLLLASISCHCSKKGTKKLLKSTPQGM
jgi:hypothetical protein